ncbi:TPA: hypothetical protein I7730_15700 [Vibrio vulnificus]|uniref:Uncharacterized protein n=1 Tax=Vibrio vulnificus TaxID=672 RepID=A0A8H9TG76_VIBVL|nr:hypothetical protein [Vibrio vulnificus]HAS8541226.1 hypothetical protein [Vibrio vulnificus]
MTNKNSLYDLSKGDSLFVSTELTWFEDYCAVSVGQFSINAKVENATPKFLDVSCPLLFGKSGVIRFSKESGKEQSPSRTMESRYISLSGNDDSEAYKSKVAFLDRLKSVRALLQRTPLASNVDWQKVTPNQLDSIFDSIAALPKKN